MLHTREVIAAIHQLPTAQREVIAAVDVAGLGYTEAADHLQIPVGTVMSRLHRGRAARRLLRGRVERAPVRRRRRPHDRGEVMPVRRRAAEPDARGDGLDRLVRGLQQRQARAHALLEQPAPRASCPVARGSGA